MTNEDLEDARLALENIKHEVKAAFYLRRLLGEELHHEEIDGHIFHLHVDESSPTAERICQVHGCGLVDKSKTSEYDCPISIEELDSDSNINQGDFI